MLLKTNTRQTPESDWEDFPSEVKAKVAADEGRLALERGNL